MTTATARAVLGLVLLGSAAAPAASQRAAPAPFAEVRRDADGDLVPDRVGETVTVEGWASADQGAFGSEAVYVQDARGGIEVRGGVLGEAPPVRAGEHVRVRGALRFRNGTASVEPTSVERTARPSWLPRPVPYRTPEAVEGRLVEAEGVVVGRSDVGAGRALMVSLDDLSLVVVFAFDGQPEPVSFEGYRPGDRVRVVGVAGQYDRAAPYADSYQIYPRRPADLRAAGIPAAAYRWAALGAGGLLLLAVGVVAALRAQVRRRVAALRESEARYHTLVDRASDAVFVHDLDGGNVELNLAARALVGVPEGHEPPPFAAVVAEADGPLMAGHVRRLRETGNARTDLRVVSADGSERLFEVESQVVTLDGVSRVLSLGRDVGARRDYERGLVEAREAAEETARVKSAFLANMSHEIRTPLTAVIGFADVLLDEVDDDARDLVEAIEFGGRRLLHTLNSVLDLARLDADQEGLRPAPLDVVRHVEQSAALLRPLADRNGLWLHVVAPDRPVTAVLDGGALDRVLTNLVGNAVKFTERGGVTVGVEREADAVRLYVSDTGIGIADAFLPDLFTEFRQQSEGDARSHEGTGLGLAITERLVALMGGTIDVRSAVGRGTTFTVTLPLGAGAPAADEATETRAPGEPDRAVALLTAGVTAGAYATA